MKQSFYKKSCRWLVMLVAMFAMNMSAMAQDVTIQLKQWNDRSTSQNYATEGIRVTYDQDGMGQSEANIYYANWPLTVTAENGKNIAKVVISNGRALTGVTEKDSKGSMTSRTAASCTWEAGEGKYTLLTFVSSTDCYAAQIDIWFEEEAPSEPIQYTVLFTGTVPEGCSASYGEDTFTSSGSTFEVAKDLKMEDLVINTTADYYADVDYNAVDHTYTVEFKHWYTYNVVVTGHMMGALQYDNDDYGDGNPVFKSKTVVDENEFSAYPLSRYDAAINVESTGDYTYTVTVKYTAYPTLNINAAAVSEGNYWTTFSFNKPVSFPEGITPCIVTGEEDGVLTVKGFEGVNNETHVFYDFQYNAVERIGNGLYIEGDNHDVSMSIQGCSVFRSLNPGQGRIEGAGIVTISHPVNISKVVVTPWGGGFGANVSLNGADPVNVGNESYTFDVDAPTCTLGLTSNGNGVYIFAIDVIVGENVLPVIPANTGVLLKSSEAMSDIQYEVKEAGNVDVSDNLLVAAGEPDYNWNDQSKTYYKFSLNSANEVGSVGFYWAVDGGHSVTQPTPNKAYLVLGGSANVRGFRLDGKTDATEGIFNALNGEEEAGAVFNLNGQRVNGKPAAGVYVKNGRKFIVK